MPTAPKKGFLSGKKTYLTALATLFVAVTSFAVGESFLGFDFSTFQELVEFSVTPVLAIFLRDGIAKS